MLFPYYFIVQLFTRPYKSPWNLLFLKFLAININLLPRSRLNKIYFLIKLREEHFFIACFDNLFITVRVVIYVLSFLLRSLCSLSVATNFLTPLYTHTPSALNAGEKRSGATCHMAMPGSSYLAKGTVRAHNSTIILNNSYLFRFLNNILKHLFCFAFWGLFQSLLELELKWLIFMHLKILGQMTEGNCYATRL